MRARLVIVFLIPLIVVFVVVGTAYARSLARSAQQDLYVDRLADIRNFVNSARQSLRADDPAGVEGELERYQELYGIPAAVIDRSGEPWVTSGLDVLSLNERAMDSVQRALSGRRSDPPQTIMPSSFDNMVIAEPVFDDGDLIGVVVTSSDLDELGLEVIRRWLLLALAGMLAAAAGLFVVSRLANWVLGPVSRLDTAMTEIWHGRTEARISEDNGPPELRQMTSVFNSMAESVEHVIHRQQEFVQNASHELRNPLNTLLLQVEHLGTGLGDEWEEYLEETREEGRRMARILDTLLKLASSQDIVAAPTETELVALTSHRIDSWHLAAHEQGVSLTMTSDEPVRCVVDETVVESAVDAVLDNAVKFSDPGSTVDVTVTNGGDMACIAIQDHGPGLPDEALEKVRDRFWRSAEHQNAPGSGLGLAIATELITSCGGRFDVESPEEGGLLVSLHVPVEGPT